MLRRNLKHMARYPSVSVMIVGIPVVLLLLFVYVFGRTLGAGLDALTGGREAYVNYVTPGIILVTVAGVAQGTALAVSMDMADGIIARFRTMGIARGAVLTGHVLGSTLQTLLGMVAVIGVALAVGFRPNAGLAEWVAAAGLLAMVTVAITWLSVALGLQREERGGREQRDDAADAPGVHRQRLRPHRIDARGAARLRRVPAVHARSSRRFAACSWARRSGTMRCSPSPGAPRSGSRATGGRCGCTTATPPAGSACSAPAPRKASLSVGRGMQAQVQGCALGNAGIGSTSGFGGFT